MTKTRVSVKPEELQPNDWVKVDGFGRVPASTVYEELYATDWHRVDDLDKRYVTVWCGEDEYQARFRRSSVIAAEREVEPEPKVAVGTWQHDIALRGDHWFECACDRRASYLAHRVLRSTGWHVGDERKQNVRLAAGMMAKANGYGAGMSLEEHPRQFRGESVYIREARCEWIRVDDFVTGRLWDIHELNLSPEDRRCKS